MRALKALLIVLLLCAIALLVNAQGTIIPIVCERRPCPQPPRPLPSIPNILPVKSVKIDTQIVDQVATTHVEQIFLNQTPHTLEGIYFFPIPDSASVEEFAIWEDGQRLSGEVFSREEARRIYEEIVRNKRDPGLLEYVGKNLLKVSIFPIQPYSEKKVEIRFSEVLKAEFGLVSYRYPVGAGQRAWHFQSGSQKGDFSGVIRIRSRQPIRSIYSPSHQIRVTKKNDSEAVVTFEISEKSGTDFHLFYNLSEDDFGLTLLTYREPAKDGFFLLLVSPKDELQMQEIAEKDVVFVIDTSGSMSESSKIEQAKSALLFGIRGLRDSDRFNIISFAGEERLFSPNLLQADSENKKRAEEFVKHLRASGGTNINDALIAAKLQFQDLSNRVKFLVFLTDGQPTVGETDVEKIMNNFRGAVKVDGLRLFVFGIGYDVNTILLDKLASENSGFSEYVEPGENLEIKVSAFFEKINYPVLTDIKVDFGSIRTEMIYPRRIPDLFKGTQVILIGKYKDSGNRATIILRGKIGQRERIFRYAADFPQLSEENVFLPRLWAIRRVGWLTEQIRINGEQKELKDEIIELGKRYGIVTPYTSSLALERGIKNESIRKVFESSLSRAAVGVEAVMLSKQAQKQQQVVTVDLSGIIAFSVEYVRQVEGKIFYRVDSIWQDAELLDKNPDLPEVKLKFASEEFFKVLREDPSLAKFFAIGEQVVVLWKGKVYRVMN